MNGGLRQSMAWLHTWSGLLFGWLLFVIFACGTTAYFQEEITRWMQPEVRGEADPAAAADGAARWLTAHAPGSTDWYITLPGKRAATTALFWSPAEAAAEDAPTEATLDGSGREVAARKTAGGFFLYRFHFDLHYMPVMWARYLVGLAAMMMLVAILSGIVTHKKIFADFFMLRFGKGQRSWLDAHNVTAVLALPFHLMITYTGLVTLDNQLSPAPIAALYASEDSFFAEAFPQGAAAERTGKAAPLAPLGPMLAEAGRRWQGRAVGYIYVANPNDIAARVTLTSAPSAAIDARGDTLQFDGVSGRVLEPGPERGAARKTEGVMIGLHAGRFADTTLRWFYFLSGLFGTAMVGTGLILWTSKRRAKLPDPARPHLGFRIVERLNIAVVAGFPIALGGYFLANRLLPFGLENRAEREVDSLFLLWGVMTIVALLGAPRGAWRNLCAVGALLFAAIPLINALTTDRGLLASVMAGDAPYVAFDLMMAGVAIGFGYAWALLRRSPKTVRRRRAG